MDITVCEDCGETPGLMSAIRLRCFKCGGGLIKKPLTAQKDGAEEGGKMEALKDRIILLLMDNDINESGHENYTDTAQKILYLTAKKDPSADVPLQCGVRRCPQCKAPRRGDECWKCGEATFEPCEGWEDPKLPPIDRIRELAKEVGYAIGEHGSKERDLDVIAAPWTEGAVDIVDLLLHISHGLKGKILGGIEDKPFGRKGANIQLDGYYKAIDISVCPKIQNA